MISIPKISITTVTSKSKNSKSFFPVGFLFTSLTINKKESIRILLNSVQCNIPCKNKFCSHSHQYIYYSNGFVKFNECHIQEIQNINFHYHPHLSSELSTKINEYIKRKQNSKQSQNINNDTPYIQWQPIVVIDHEKKTLEAIKSANFKPFLCKFHFASLFYRLLNDLKLTSPQKLLLVIAFKLNLYESNWNLINFLHILSGNRIPIDEFNNKAKSFYDPNSNIDMNINININPNGMIMDSQKTLFELTPHENNISDISSKYQLPSTKLQKIVSFLNKLNNSWGGDVFKEHQNSFITNQTITTNGFAEEINGLIKHKFLKSGAVKRYDIIEAVGGQLSLDKSLYFRLKSANLTDKNKLDCYIQQQIYLKGFGGDIGNNTLKTTELYRIYETYHKLPNDPLFLFLKNSSLLELQPHQEIFKELLQAREDNNDTSVLRQNILNQKIQNLLLEKLSYSINRTDSIFQYYDSKITKEEKNKKSFSIFDEKRKKNRKTISTSVSTNLIKKFDQSSFIQNINSSDKKIKKIVFEGIFYYLINNVCRKYNFL